MKSDFRGEVLFEDNHLIAVNKPSGILVQGDETGDVPLVDRIKDYIKEKYGKPGAVFLGVVHRLDRPVTGVVVFARTSKALSRMNELFRSRATEKTYWAVTENKPAASEGTLVHWLSKDDKKNKTTTFIRETEGALKSELSYKLMKARSGLYLLEVKPITGRSHQIRAQLAAMGTPIYGDVKYGSDARPDSGGIGLHARALKFIHPVTKGEMSIVAETPDRREWTIWQ